MFAESEAVALGVIGDIYAYLQETPTLPVRDYGQVGNPIDFYVEVDPQSVEKRRSARPTNPWQRHWWLCAFEVLDERTNA